MNQEEIIYDRAKENLRKHWRTDGRSINKKIIYEYSITLYLMRQEYKEDTRSYSITQSIYEEERARIFQLKKKIRQNEECYEDAIEACKDALEYIELVVRPRINIRAIA